MISSAGSQIVKELIGAGIIPPNCTRWELVADMHSAVALRFEVLVTQEQYDRIGGAILHNPEEAKSIAQITVWGGMSRPVRMTP